ncbi:hypothetical protein BX616_005231 [Lobosporangium transversale]|nr:hypothetical protein BX616_005231 [Lobosporangium transversale]
MMQNKYNIRKGSPSFFSAWLTNCIIHSFILLFFFEIGEQCSVASDCAAYAFYTQRNIPIPADLCSPSHCTLESTCGSPWQESYAPTNHSFSSDRDHSQISCCGGQPAGQICSLVGNNVDSCAYHNLCQFDLDDVMKGPGDEAHPSSDPSFNHGYTLDQMREQGLGFCRKIDQRKHVWIGVVITLISSTVLNLGLNGQKYALRKHDERRVLKQLEMEEEHERWRQELGWSEEQVQQEADRLYEEKENRHGKLYRRLKPYMFWRNIFVSKLWAAGLAVFIIGNLGGFIALRFAPQSLTAPLGSISLISNVIIAPLINKEVLGRWDIAGIFFIVAGSVIVVVFSGIVAQDYKLCVLINLFHKPATIIYLTFIGVCIVFTFFFIQFVEKNVENEADVAIGVSSEQQLKKEGRLYRINSNKSTQSLAFQERSKNPSIHGALVSSGANLRDAEEGRKARTSTSKEPSSEKQKQGQEQLNDISLNRTSLDTPARSSTQQQKQCDGALKSSRSHHTITSEASGTAIGASSTVLYTEPPQDNWRPSFGSSRSNSSQNSIADLESKVPSSTSNAVEDKQEPKLKFGGSVIGSAELGTSTPGAVGEHDTVAATGSSSRQGLSRMPSITPSVMSTRRHRRGQKKSHHHNGVPLTFWERVRQIEIIPTLPEEKLIRRNSPLLRFCLPLAYAGLGGMMASYTVLFAKSLINLLVTSIFDGQNQFTSFIAWVILIVTVVTAISQVYWINMGLKKYDALLQVPVFFTIWVLLDIVGGGIYYDEFAGFTAKKYALFCLGVLIVFFGVALLAKRLAVLAKEDAGDPELQAASRRESILKEIKEAKESPETLKKTAGTSGATAGVGK